MKEKRLWLGGMKEMGTEEASEHLNLLDFIKEYEWSEVILVGNEFKDISGGFQWFETSAEAAEYVREHLPKDATILIKGSRGSKMENLLSALQP